jgi:predicted acyltransferase
VRVRPHFGAVEALPPATRRVASVDALRGFTMFWIIGADGATKALAEMLSGKGTILSTAGKIIGEQFEHAEWEGLRFYDLIFPLFIFVSGVAIVCGWSSRRANPPRIGACCAGRCSCSRWGSSMAAI